MTSEAKIVISASNQTKGAFDQVKAGLGEMQASATNLVGNFALVGTALAGAFAAANLKQTINTLDALDDFAEKSGIAVESLSALRFAGEVTGTSFESLQTGVIKLSKNIAAAAAGGKEAQAAFDAIGVSVKNADGSLRNADDVIADFAERFAGYKDGAGKAALAQELFGKSGADLIPILNQGRNGLESLKEEARALGAVYSGETAKAAATFNDDLKKLALSSEGLRVELLGGVIPAINKLLESFLSVKKNGQLGTLLNPFAGLGNLGKQSEDYAADVAKASAEVERLQELLRTGPTINRTFVSDRLREATQQLNDAQETYLNVQRNLEKANPSPETLRFLRAANQGAKVDAPIVSSSKSANNSGLDQGKAFLDNLQKQVTKLKESEFAALRLEAAQKGVASQAEKYIVELEAAKRLKEQLADFERSALETERQRVEADKVLNDALLSLAESAQKVNEETALFGKTESQIKRIAELKQLDQAATRALANATGEDVNTIIQAWDRAKAALENALAGQESQSKIQEGLERVRQSAEQAADRITGYLADALNADDPLKSLKKSFERELLNMALSPALNALRDALASVFKQSGGGPGSSGFLDFLGSLAGNSGGGSGGTDLGGFFANGGNPPLGKVSVVGERGPEFFVPRTQGTIVPMEKVGGVSVNNVYNFSQGTTRAELIAVAEQTRKATIADVQQMFARNNPLMAA